MRYVVHNPFQGVANPNAAPVAEGISNLATALFGDPTANPYEREKDRVSAIKTGLEIDKMQREENAASDFFSALSAPDDQGNPATNELMNSRLAKAYIDLSDRVGPESASKTMRGVLAVMPSSDTMRANAAVANGMAISPNDAFSLPGQDRIRQENVQNEILKDNSVTKIVPEGGTIVQIRPGGVASPAAAAPGAVVNGLDAPLVPPGAGGTDMASVQPPQGNVNVLYSQPRRAQPAPEKVIDDITSMLRLKDNLTTVENNKNVFGPVEGPARKMIPGGYGSPEANDAYAAQGAIRADVQSVIKGIPSNYDAKIFENTLPLPGDGPELITAKKALLDKTIELGIRNTIANYEGTKQAIPPAIIQQITSRGINLDDLLRRDNSPQTLQQELDQVGAQAAQLGGRNPQEYVRGQQQQTAPTIQTQQEYDALPSGAQYTDPDDGKLYRKP